MSCWYCSTCNISKHIVPSKDIIKLYDKYNPYDVLLIGGEPLLLPPEYYMEILDGGCKFGISTNFTLYNSNREKWNKVFTHPNFLGIGGSCDKCESNEEFLKIYYQLKEAGILAGLILTLDDKDYTISLNKAMTWLDLAYKHDLSLKINYVVPTGRALDNLSQILKISDVFNIYCELLDEMEKRKFTNTMINPFETIIDSMINGNNYVCPYNRHCANYSGILNFEAEDLEKSYYCPALGDLGEDNKFIETIIPNKCYLCEYFIICRGCNIRSWTVKVLNDDNYCNAAKRFFIKLDSLKEQFIESKKNKSIHKNN